MSDHTYTLVLIALTAAIAVSVIFWRDWYFSHHDRDWLDDIW